MDPDFQVEVESNLKNEFKNDSIDFSLPEINTIQSNKDILNENDLDFNEDPIELPNEKVHIDETFSDQKLSDYLNESLIDALDNSYVSNVKDDQNSSYSISDNFSKLGSFQAFNGPYFIPRHKLSKVGKNKFKIIKNKYDEIDSNLLIPNNGNMSINFPTKMKGGDWVCLFCNTINYFYRLKCYCCGILKIASIKMLKKLRNSEYQKNVNHKDDFNNSKKNI